MQGKTSIKRKDQNEAYNTKNEAKMRRNVMSNHPYRRSVKAHGKTRINEENDKSKKIGAKSNL